MSADLEARFRVRLEGAQELSGFFERGNRGARDFQSNITRAFGAAGREIVQFGLQTAKSLAQLATGSIGIAQTAKNVLDFRDSLSDLAVQSGLSDEKLGDLATQIHGVSKASNQMQGDVTEALAAFVARTGDIKTARDNLEMYAKVATATGASLKDVALIGVELSDKLKIKDPAQQAQALAILTAQGRAGAVEIRDLATKAPAVFSAASSMFGVKGIEGLRGTGALAEVFAKAFGGSGTAASVSTSIQNTFKDILAHQDAIEHAGIKVGGRDPYEVIKDLIVKTNGDPRQLMRAGGHGIFDVRAMRGINVMAEEFRRTGKFSTFDTFKNMGGADIDSDVARRMSTGASHLKSSQIAIAASSDKNLGNKFDWLASKADNLSKAFDWVTSHLTISITAAVAALAAWKVGMGALFGTGPSGFSGGGLMGNLLSGGKPLPVYVTNMGGLSGGGDAAGGAGATGGKVIGGLAGAAGIAAVVAIAARPDRQAESMDAENDRLVQSGRRREIKHWYGSTYEDVSIANQPEAQRARALVGDTVASMQAQALVMETVARMEKAVRDGMKGAKVVAAEDGTRGHGTLARRGR